MRSFHSSVFSKQPVSPLWPLFHTITDAITRDDVSKGRRIARSAALLTKRLLSYCSLNVLHRTPLRQPLLSISPVIRIQLWYWANFSIPGNFRVCGSHVRHSIRTEVFQSSVHRSCFHPRDCHVCNSLSGMVKEKVRPCACLGFYPNSPTSPFHDLLDESRPHTRTGSFTCEIREKGRRRNFKMNVGSTFRFIIPVHG